MPLVLAVNVIVLLLGMYWMLPYDLDKVSQSVIATNFFSNNILEFISSGDYWSVRNEYKPLMHTWSLGIEEQFYLLYSILFLATAKSQFCFDRIVSILLLLTFISIFIFLSVDNAQAIFYLIPYRFFELSGGGLVAILLATNVLSDRSKLFVSIAVGLAIAIAFICLNSNRVYVLSTVLIVTLYLLNHDRLSISSAPIFENRFLVFIGKISFSLYMWHQVVLAFVRYSFVDVLTPSVSVLCFVSFVLLAYISYLIIEQPFRKPIIMSDKKVLWIVSFLFVLTTVSSAWIYIHGGVIRSFPELGISSGDSYRNMHLDYNTRHLNLDKDFTESKKTKVLVIGNSFARDWINVLLESNYSDQIEVSYLINDKDWDLTYERISDADVVFSFGLTKAYFKNKLHMSDIDIRKLWSIGVKHYGESNGQVYARRHDSDYCTQSIEINEGAIDRNRYLAESWGDRYIDIMNLSLLEDNEMPVFDSNCQFLSQDGLHFSKAGAIHYANLFSDTLTTPNFKFIFGY
jgi:peptidoglycan/LPS O-acetylase OafA/YrhL